MKFLRNATTGEIFGLTLEARDTLEEMAAQAPMTMYELAGKIEDIITWTGEYKDVKAVEEYKRGLVIQLNAWAIEEELAAKEGKGMLKPAPLLRKVADQIEKGWL